jgi:basic membrane protein A and related proteins
VRKSLLAAAALCVAALSIVAGLANAAPKATITAALVSDIGKFNDRGFNQNQLAGLLRAKAQLGVNTIPLQSNSTSDYIPNLTSAVRQHADIVISAGFLLADSTATMAKKFPDTHFAITDYPVEAAPFADKKGKVLYTNVEGLTYAANESGCLVGVLAAKMAQRMGKKVIGAVMGLKIPPVDIWTAGYRYCAQKAVPGTKVLTGYSQSFTETDKCKTVADNQLGQGAQVLFQVAGGCGLGTLKAADEAGKWGIGVDVDQYKLAKRVLTSAVKRVDTGVYDAIQQVKQGKWNGGHDLVFNLKNGGMSVGKINPAVPKSDITLMNQYRQKIISGSLKIPSSLG